MPSVMVGVGFSTKKKSTTTVQISLSPSSISLSAGSPTAQMTGVAKDINGNPTGQRVYYYSTDVNVATVDSNTGLVTRIAAGSCTIYCTLTPAPSASVPLISGAVKWGAITPGSMSNPTGGSGGPYTYSCSDLPAGLNISSGGLISGTPTVANGSTGILFHIVVTDSVGNTGITIGSIAISYGLDIPAPDFSGLSVVIAPDLSGVTTLAQLISLGFLTGNPGDGTQNDYRNDRTMSVGANQIITDGPGGAHGLRVQFDQHPTTITNVGGISAIATSVNLADSTGIRDPLIWTGAQKPQIVFADNGETCDITGFSATSGAATATIVRTAGTIHIQGTRVDILPQETHACGINMSTPNLGHTNHPLSLEYYLRYWHLNYPTEKIDQDIDHRVGTKGMMRFTATDRAQEATGYQPGYNLTPPNPPNHTGTSGTLFTPFMDGGVVGRNCAQGRPPWLADLEGTWIYIKSTHKNNSSAGARDGYSYLWVNGILVSAVAQAYVGVLMPQGSADNPFWCDEAAVDTIYTDPISYIKLVFFDARAIGSSRFLCDLALLKAYTTL